MRSHWRVREDDDDEEDEEEEEEEEGQCFGAAYRVVGIVFGQAGPSGARKPRHAISMR